MSFLMPSGTYHNPNQKHLFIVCCNQDDNGNVLLASVSSWKNHLCDGTCRLEAGCHEFIVKESYILYRKSRIEHVSTIENGLTQNVFVKMPDVESKIVEEILAGFAESQHTPRKMKVFATGL